MKIVISLLCVLMSCSLLADENYLGQRLLQNNQLDYNSFAELANQFPAIQTYKTPTYQLYLNVLILEPMSEYLRVENPEISTRKAIGYRYIESFNLLIRDYKKIENYKILYSKPFKNRFDTIEELKAESSELRLVKLNARYAMVFLSTKAPEAQNNLHTIPVDSISYRYRPSISMVNNKSTKFSLQEVNAKPNEILVTEELSIANGYTGTIPLRAHHIEMFNKHIQFVAPQSVQFYFEIDYIFNLNGQRFSLHNSSYEDLSAYKSLLKKQTSKIKLKKSKLKSTINKICPILFK